MKKWLILIWMLLPLPVVVWHYGPGQKWLGRELAGGWVKQAREAEASHDHPKAESLYRRAMGELVKEDALGRFQLEIAALRSQYEQGDGVKAVEALEKVLMDPAYQSLPKREKAEARAVAGQMHYYSAWVMRLEGAKRELWLEEAELARQNFRFLTEQQMKEGKLEQAKVMQDQLESAIELQRMGITELRARPLPDKVRKQSGQGASESKQKGREQRGQGPPGKGESEQGKPDKGAGTTKYPAGKGS